MFRSAILLTFALGLVASGTPVANEPAVTSGIRIALPKRNSLKNEDGTFNYEKAVRETVKLKNKHRQNLINIATNLGYDALPKGAEIKPAAKLPKSLEKRGAVKLTDQAQEIEWTGPVEIGTPQQSFTIDFDTGSADLWVPSSSCSSCQGHKAYNPSLSSTSSKRSGSFNITYGDGSNVSGTPYTDNVHIGGVDIKNQFFAAVTMESSAFVQDPADGLCGLGLRNLSYLSEDPPFITAVKQGAVREGIFSFKLAEVGSELCFGGRNRQLYKGEIEEHGLVSSVGYWQIGGASVKLNGKAVVSGFDTIVDSGTSLIVTPTAQGAAFWNQVQGAELFDEDVGLYSFPCDSPPEVAFSWGGKDWSINATDLNLGETAQGTGQCVGAIQALDIGLGDSVWITGDTFMKNVYTIFSVDCNSVGFAELA
ncbi:acid protease [Trametes punicea]|nr:acid protease [Trametes punicea]